MSCNFETELVLILTLGHRKPKLLALFTWKIQGAEIAAKRFEKRWYGRARFARVLAGALPCPQI